MAVEVMRLSVGTMGVTLQCLKFGCALIDGLHRHKVQRIEVMVVRIDAVSCRVGVMGRRDEFRGNLLANLSA
jgi:hypothetical protein